MAISVEDTISVFLKQCGGEASLNLKVGGYLNTKGVTLAEVTPYKVGVYTPRVQLSKSLTGNLPGISKILRQENHHTLVFPVENYYGAAFGFQLRTMTTPKRVTNYIYEPLNEYFGISFGLPVALPYIASQEDVILVEGPFDLFMVSKFRRNVVCVLGSHLSKPLLNVLTRFARRFWIAFDHDSPGIAGTRQAVKLLADKGLVGYSLDYGDEENPVLAFSRNPRQFEAKMKDLKPRSE